jgi:hypothetical protein
VAVAAAVQATSLLTRGIPQKLPIRTKDKKMSTVAPWLFSREGVVVYSTSDASSHTPSSLLSMLVTLFRRSHGAFFLARSNLLWRLSKCQVKNFPKSHFKKQNNYKILLFQIGFY